MIDGWGISCEIDLIWMSLEFTDDQVMLGAVEQQAITWANVDPDLCHHMVSLDKNELIGFIILDIHHHITVFCNISWMWTEYENNIKYMQLILLAMGTTDTSLIPNWICFQLKIHDMVIEIKNENDTNYFTFNKFN